MRKTSIGILFGILITVSILKSCTTDEDLQCSDLQVEELSWVRNAIEDIQNDPFSVNNGSYISKATLKGETVIIFGNC